MNDITEYGRSGELSDLITYLEANYRRERGLLPTDMLLDDDFVSWAKQHLSDNRPNEVFAVDNNYGILLTNGQRIKLSPDPQGYVPSNGDMANPDSSISIMQTR